MFHSPDYQTTLIKKIKASPFCSNHNLKLLCNEFMLRKSFSI